MALAEEVKWPEAIDKIKELQKSLEDKPTPELDADCYAEVNGQPQPLDSSVPTALSIFEMAGTDSAKFNSLQFSDCLSKIPFGDEILEGTSGSYNCSPLFNAILHRNIAAAGQLLERGVDVFTIAKGDSKGAKKGYSVFHEACENGDINWLSLLLEHNVLKEQPVGSGANLVSMWEVERATPEETVINVTENIFTKTTKRVVTTKIVSKKSAIIVRELRDSNENTPLHIACEKNFIEGIELLLYRQGIQSASLASLPAHLLTYLLIYFSLAKITRTERLQINSCTLSRILPARLLTTCSVLRTR